MYEDLIIEGITRLDIQNKILEQDNKCYWLGVQFSSNVHHPFYPIVNIMHKEKDVQYDNIVISTRFAAYARNNCEFIHFHHIVVDVLESMLDGGQRPPYVDSIIVDRRNRKNTADNQAEAGPSIAHMMGDVTHLNPKLSKYVNSIKPAH